MPRTSLLPRALLTIAAATSPLCHGESNLQSGAGSPLTATAHVDFQITIPKILFLRVGTGTGTVAGDDTIIVVLGADAAADDLRRFLGAES